ncbi:transcriptional regulator, MarR family [mine drainage metagenome]|uniref:Transcriptional regulator, MarR family n=1 Tax=mine drainage metagenome TaxID=410659 RepID=T1A699_9ZZZZ
MEGWGEVMKKRVGEDLRSPESPGSLRIIRPLVEAYLGFVRESDRNIRSMGLTPGQFDVIATLGDTEGMSCQELSRRTLVTKGTLTGLLDRLLLKDLISEEVSPTDRRSRIIRLTEKGEAVFKKTFHAQIDHLDPFFERALTAEEVEQLRALLLKISDVFSRKGPDGRGKKKDKSF